MTPQFFDRQMHQERIVLVNEQAIHRLRDELRIAQETARLYFGSVLGLRLLKKPPKDASWTDYWSTTCDVIEYSYK